MTIKYDFLKVCHCYFFCCCYINRKSTSIYNYMDINVFNNHCLFSAGQLCSVPTICLAGCCVVSNLPSFKQNKSVHKACCCHTIGPLSCTFLFWMVSNSSFHFSAFISQSLYQSAGFYSQNIGQCNFLKKGLGQDPFIKLGYNG